MPDQFAIQEFTIRSELPQDYAQIESLLDSAFEGHYEAELVARIRQSPEYLNDLSLVALQGQQVIAYIMLSYVTLNGEKDSYPVLSLGPVAVLPSHQKLGIGGKLILEGISLADEREESLIVLLGHANYYPRFGFERASLHNIYPPVDWSDECYMVLALSRYSPVMQGKVSYPQTWQIETAPRKA